MIHAKIEDVTPEFIQEQYKYRETLRGDYAWVIRVVGGNPLVQYIWLDDPFLPFCLTTYEDHKFLKEIPWPLFEIDSKRNFNFRVFIRKDVYGNFLCLFIADWYKFYYFCRAQNYKLLLLAKKLGLVEYKIGESISWINSFKLSPMRLLNKINSQKAEF